MAPQYTKNSARLCCYLLTNVIFRLDFRAQCAVLRNTIKLLYIQNGRLWSNAETQVNIKRYSINSMNSCCYRLSFDFKSFKQLTYNTRLFLFLLQLVEFAISISFPYFHPWFERLKIGGFL